MLPTFSSILSVIPNFERVLLNFDEMLAEFAGFCQLLQEFDEPNFDEFLEFCSDVWSAKNEEEYEKMLCCRKNENSTKES